MQTKTISFLPIKFKIHPIFLSFPGKNSTCRPKRSLSDPSNSRSAPSCVLSPERIQHAAQNDLFPTHRIQDAAHLAFFPPERIQHAAQNVLFLSLRIQDASHLAFFRLKEFNFPPKTFS